MKKSKVAVILSGVLVVVAVAIVLLLLLVKALWAWTVPDLFPGAVSQGLVAASISWFTALKLAFFLAVLAGLAGVRGHGKG